MMLSRRNFLRLALLAGAATLTRCSSGFRPAQPSAGGAVLTEGSAAVATVPGAAAPAVALDKPIYWEADRRIAEWLQGVRTTPDPNYTPVITAPSLVEMANEVDVRVTVPLAATPERYIQRLILYDPESVIKVKFVAALSSRVLAADVSALIKMLRNSQLAAIAESNTGERWWSQSNAIQVGQGGCIVGQEPARTLPDDVLRVKFREADSDLVRMDVQLYHPMASGFSMDDAGTVTRVHDPFYASRLTVIYGGETIADFELTPGLSDNPLISFAMRPLGKEPVTATLLNNAGDTFSLNALITV